MASRIRVDNHRWRRSRSAHMATAVRSMLAIRAETYRSSGEINDVWPETIPKSPWAAISSFSWVSFTTATFVFSHRLSVVRVTVVWRPATAIREAIIATSSPVSFHQQFYIQNHHNNNINITLLLDVYVHVVFVEKISSSHYKCHWTGFLASNDKVIEP